MKSSGGVARPRVKGVSRHVRENTELWGDAVAEFEAGNFSRAADIFTRMDFTTAQVTFNAGTAHMALGEYEEAIEVRSTLWRLCACEAMPWVKPLAFL